MNTKRYMLAAGATVLAFGLAMPASALSIQGVTDAAADLSTSLTNPSAIDVAAITNANGSVDVKSASSSGTSASGSASVSGSASGNTNGSGQGIGANIRSMLNALVGGSISTGDDDATTSSDVDAQGKASSGASVKSVLNTILVTRSDLSAGSAVATSLDLSSVTAESDLEGYVAAQLESDSNIESIELASDSVAITYKDKAQLFGVIPVTVDATATVDAAGNVEVSYPWYSFLMATDKEELESKIESRVRAALGATAGTSADASAALSATADGTAEVNDDGARAQAGAQASADAAARLSAQAQARLVAEVKAAMAEALAEADAATDVDASADANVTGSGSATIR